VANAGYWPLEYNLALADTAVSRTGHGWGSIPIRLKTATARGRPRRNRGTPLGKVGGH
jgi:hypothetical protein